MAVVSGWWGRTWPSLLGAVVVLTVAAPAAVASYRHAREVVARHDPEGAPWLPLSVDGMLLAALVVMWVRRRRGVPVGRGPWAAFVFGIVVTIAGNAAAVETPSVEAYAVHLFPPLALAIALELVALVAGRARPVLDVVLTEPVVSEPVLTAVPTVPVAALATTEPVPAPERAREPEPEHVAVHVEPEPAPVVVEEAVGPAVDTEPVPTVPAEPEPVQGTDDEIRAWLRQNGIPSRRQLGKVYRCGTTRYDRLADEARALTVAS